MPLRRITTGYHGSMLMRNLRLLAILLLGLFVSARAQPVAETVPFVILHTNDLHGQLRPIPDPRSKEGTAQLVGGFQELVAAIDAERAQVSHSILVDAGDWFQGTPEGTLSRGRCMLELMNAVGYDFVTVGNHDFDCGQDALRDLLRMARFRPLCRNLRLAPDGVGVSDDTREILSRLEPGGVVSIEGFRVRVEGLLCEEAPRIVPASLLRGFSVLPEIESAESLKEGSAAPDYDALVLVNHIGKDRNVALARKVPGIDVIIGGHAHKDALDEGVLVASTGTLIAQSAALSQALGVVTLEIDPKARRIVRKSARLRRITPVADAYIARVTPVIERYESQVAARMNVPIAVAPALLRKDGSLESPSEVGQWLVLLMKSHTGADLAVHNVGGIRAPIPGGIVRIRELFQVSPFGNRLVTVSLTGADLMELARITLRNPGRGCVFGGVEIRYSVDDEGARELVEIHLDGKPIRETDTYRVATTDYLAGGADHMSPFARATGRVDADITLLDATLDAARSKREIVAPKLTMFVKVPKAVPVGR